MPSGSPETSILTLPQKHSPLCVAIVQLLVAPRSDFIQPPQFSPQIIRVVAPASSSKQKSDLVRSPALGISCATAVDRAASRKRGIQHGFDIWLSSDFLRVAEPSKDCRPPRE